MKNNFEFIFNEYVYKFNLIEKYDFMTGFKKKIVCFFMVDSSTWRWIKIVYISTENMAHCVP